MEPEPEVEITKEMLKDMRSKDREKKRESFLNNRALRGNPGVPKSNGIDAHWILLHGPEKPPTRVSIMPINLKKASDGNEARIFAAEAKRNRRNDKRLAANRNALIGKIDLANIFKQEESA